MQAHESSSPATKLGMIFSEGLTKILSNAGTMRWIVTPSQDPLAMPLDPASMACFKFTFGGSMEGEAFLLLRTTEIALLALKSADTQKDLSKQLCSTFESSTDDLSRLFLEYGAVNLQAEASVYPERPEVSAIELVARVEGGNSSVSIILIPHPKLIDSMLTLSAQAFAYPAAVPAANLDLVLDVALNVTLRFGQRQLSLREVLDLTSGSVVELDRQVDEPVELVLDGRVVARGEAVIIDGNYGMRITQVLQPIMT